MFLSDLKNVPIQIQISSFQGSVTTWGRYHLSRWDMIEGSLEVKLPTIWTNGKAQVRRVREEKRREEKEKRRREKKREDQRSEIREEKESEERVTRKSQKKESEERVRRKKIQVREKVGKSRNTVFFQWLLAPEGRKVGSLKRRVRSHLARWEIKNCIQLWREAHFQVKMYKTHQRRITFGSCDVEKVHAAVARSTLRSQNLQNTPFLEHFWNVRCRKKCTPVWPETHFQVKMYKTHHVRSTVGSWDVQKVHAAVARGTFPSQKCKTLTGTGHFWTFRRFAWQAQGIVHLVKSEQNVRVL